MDVILRTIGEWHSGVSAGSNLLLVLLDNGFVPAAMRPIKPDDEEIDQRAVVLVSKLTYHTTGKQRLLEGRVVR
jgi:hypothetical protein